MKIGVTIALRVPCLLAVRASHQIAWTGLVTCTHRDFAREEGVVAVYRTEQANAKNARWHLPPARTDEQNHAAALL